MLYVIPFIILLVVAVILKKRENSQKQEATSPKTVNKKTNKKASSKSSKSSREKSKVNVVEDTLPPVPQSTPVPEAVRQKIQQLIQEKQYSAAEAQVNQALKKDNTQHALYLLLLEVHIAQKDEFAITQLISHIRSLALNEIATQAETRQKEYDSSRQPDAIDFPQAQTYEEPKNIPDTTAQFDQLTTSSSEASFDDLQKDYTPVKQEPAVEVKPLEFNFSFEKTAATETTSQSVHEPEVSTSQQVPEVSSSQETNELADLEFSFDLAPLHETEEKTQAVEVKADQENSVNALDFNLDLNPSSSETKSVEQVPSLDELTLVEQAPLEATSITPLEFSLDEPALVTTPETETLNHIEAVNEEATQTQIEDPLLDAFPELKQLDENELDLQLAEQYIKLGAYPAAHALLASNEQKFNTEQQQRAKNLLNRIAS
jgi:thioredoxin-like negative regulator of GroEL